MKSLYPKKWGASFWIMLEGLPVLFTRFHGRLAKEFLHTVAHVLPCRSCQISFQRYVRTHPLTRYWVATPVRVGMWINRAHNDVNRRTGKPHARWTWAEHKQWRTEHIDMDTWKEALFASLYFMLHRYPARNPEAHTGGLHKNNTYLDLDHVGSVREHYNGFFTLLAEIVQEEEPQLAEDLRSIQTLCQRNNRVCLVTALHRLEQHQTGETMPLHHRKQDLRQSEVPQQNEVTERNEVR